MLTATDTDNRLDAIATLTGEIQTLLAAYTASGTKRADEAAIDDKFRAIVQHVETLQHSWTAP